MGIKEHLSDDLILATARNSGLDVERLKKDMADDAIARQIKGNIDLGAEVGVRGTPMFIIGEDVYPGALQYEQLKKAVEEARAPAKK
jgi:predicted DsbA family dithiol-disulfide isomerase